MPAFHTAGMASRGERARSPKPHQRIATTDNGTIGRNIKEYRIATPIDMPVPRVSIPSKSVIFRREATQTRRLEVGISANSRTCAGVGRGSKKFLAHICVVSSKTIAAQGKITPARSKNMPGLAGGFPFGFCLDVPPEIGLTFGFETGLEPFVLDCLESLPFPDAAEPVELEKPQADEPEPEVDCKEFCATAVPDFEPDSADLPDLEPDMPFEPGLEPAPGLEPLPGLPSG